MKRIIALLALVAVVVSGGGFFGLEVLVQDSSPRRMTARLHEERSSVSPYGAAAQRTMFTPDRIAIERLDGTLVAGPRAPRDSSGHQMNTPWDPLHRAYFNGYALWTYLTTPFLLAMSGVRVGRSSRGRRGQRSGAPCEHTLRARSRLIVPFGTYISAAI